MKHGVSADAAHVAPQVHERLQRVRALLLSP